MIVQAILEFLVSIPNALLDGLADIGFSLAIPADVHNGLSILTANLGYLFPIGALMPILVATIALRFGRAIWAIVIRIKSFIPTMGA